jgi:hypothetical protein
MAAHLVLSPTGLVHIAPFRTRTRCGNAIDLAGEWEDLGQTLPLETPSAILRRIEIPVCGRCIKQVGSRGR